MGVSWQWERRSRAVDVRQLTDSAPPAIDVRQLAEKDAELVAEVLAGGYVALRRSATRDRAVHNAYWRMQSGEKSEAQDKCVLLHETHAKLFPPTGGSAGSAADAGPPEDVLPAEAVDEWQVALFENGDVEVVPASWVSLEPAEEAEDEAATTAAHVEHRLLVDAVQDSGLRAMRQSGKPIHSARYRGDDGEKGSNLEMCVVLGDAAKGQRKVVLFAFGILQVVPAEWVSHQPTEAAGPLSKNALQTYALRSQHAAIEGVHEKRARHSAVDSAESCRARNERIHEASHLARSSLWTVRLEEVPSDHMEVCRKLLTCRARNETERLGITNPPGMIQSSAMVLVPAVLGIAPFVINLAGARRQCTVDEDELTVPCAEIDADAFILTCLIWLVGCALCLLEFYRTQLRPLGFGHMLHYAYIYGSAGSTFCLLEYLFREKVPPGLPAHISFHMGCLVASIWGCE
jgi:hypothetical protein